MFIFISNAIIPQSTQSKSLFSYCIFTTCYYISLLQDPTIRYGKNKISFWLNALEMIVFQNKNTSVLGGKGVRASVHSTTSNRVSNMNQATPITWAIVFNEAGDNFYFLKLF